MLGMRERNCGDQQEYDAALHDVIELMFRLRTWGSFLLVLNSHVICSVNIYSIDMQLAGPLLVQIGFELRKVLSTRLHVRLTARAMS